MVDTGKEKKLPQYIIDAAAKGRSEKISRGNCHLAKKLKMVDLEGNIIKNFDCFIDAADYISLNKYLLDLVPLPSRGSISNRKITTDYIKRKISEAIKKNNLFCGYKWYFIESVTTNRDECSGVGVV